MLCKKFRKPSAYEVVIFMALSLYTLSMFVLFFWAFNTSLKNDRAPAFEFIRNPVGLAKKFSLKNYVEAFEALSTHTIGIGKNEPNVKLFGLFFNSLIYAGGSAFCQAACTCLVGYLTAKYNYKFSKIFHSMVIVTMILPIVGSLASQLEVIQALGLYDTVFGVYFMKFGFTNMYYLVFYAMFASVSWSYAESAFLDGANHFQVFFRIMLPLASTLFGVVFILYFVEYWNDYQFPMLFLKSMPTVAWILQEYLFSFNQELANVPMKVTGACLTFMPILIVFIIFRDKLMGNLTEGGVKY